VELSFPLSGGLELRLADGPSGAWQPGGRQPSGDGRQPSGDGYPTARLQKGLVLLRDGEDLAQEGVGFGVPVLKQGARTVFAGRMDLEPEPGGAGWAATATFHMDLVERLAGPDGGGPATPAFYTVRDALAALHRRAPVLRGPLTAASNAVRRRFGWQTTFEETPSCGPVRVTYTALPRGRVHVAVDLTGLRAPGVTEVVLMNELGARFDRYVDSAGVRLRRTAIGTWEHVAAERAAFLSGAARVAFSLTQTDGARLYRGWELVGSRLAWAGFGYSLEPARPTLAYGLTVERLP
jgi:hypothetical protein